ncbi:MAG: hypothetical protein AB7S78_01560 [Candidatus Omnitrophota bacterium]
MSNDDYNAGYRGGQYHHGMDSGEYNRGKSQKALEDTLGGAGKKVEVPGVAYTLILVSPFIWMVYPVMGLMIYAAVGGTVLLFRALHVPKEWGIFIGLIPFAMSFFWGMILENKVSQIKLYRWYRDAQRVCLAFVVPVVLVMRDGAFTADEAGALGVCFFAAVIIFITFQRMDLIYFPALKEIKKMQEQLKKGERPKRPLMKRLVFGFCWFVPVMVILTLADGLVLMQFMKEASQREAFTKQYGIIVGSINCAIWYGLCLLGKLPGTGKYTFSKEYEENLKGLQAPQ